MGIFVQPILQGGIEPYLSKFTNGFDIQFIPIADDPSQDLIKLNDDVDAIYFLHNLYKNLEDNQALIDGINDRNSPSYCLIGRNDVQFGILAMKNLINFHIQPNKYLSTFAMWS